MESGRGKRSAPDFPESECDLFEVFRGSDLPKVIVDAFTLLMDDLLDNEEDFFELELLLEDEDPQLRKMLNRAKVNRPPSKATLMHAQRVKWRENGYVELFQQGRWTWETGLSEEHFQYVVKLVADKYATTSLEFKKRRPRVLCLEAQVALLCVMLRTGDQPSELALRYDLAVASLRRCLFWMLPLMRSSLQEVYFDENPAECPLGTVGIIDATTHPRDRVHPGEDTFFRGDKKVHFVSSQVVVDHSGYVNSITIAKGHNNDRGLYRLSEMDAFLVEQNWTLLADQGYSDERLLTAISKGEELLDPYSFASLLNRQIHASRGLIEAVNSWMKNWKFLERKCKILPKAQAMFIVVAANLYNITHSPIIDSFSARL